MSDAEPNPIPEEEIDHAIADILHPYAEGDFDLEEFDSLLDELNADIVKTFIYLKEIIPELQFDAHEYLEKCKNNLPVSDLDAELFEQVATIVDSQLPESAPELERMADKLGKATKIITTCNPLLQSILLKALDALMPIEPTVYELSDSELRLLNLAHNGGSPEREEEYAYVRILMRTQLLAEVENNLRNEYGEFDALHSVAYHLLNLGGQLGGISWERYHTNDSPEEIRERNFQNALDEIKMRKRLLFREGPLSEQDIDILLIVMQDLMLSYLKNYKGIHKD